MEWCRFVREQYYRQTDAKVSWLEITEEKPLTTSKKMHARMDIEVEYASDIRPDIDNIYKGLADALFTNDKYLMHGSFTSKYSPEKVGSVKIKITLYDSA